MLNSLTVFSAFVGILIFGYISLVRLLFRQQLNSSGFKSTMSGLRSNELLRNLGSSAFFLSLPATALLLFWGWGPALIWLGIFHIGVETLFHLQYSSQNHNDSIADHLLRASRPSLATAEQGLIQVFFLLSMAVVTALVATLLDRQPGLLFALVFLLPARKLISHPSPALPKAVRLLGGLALLAIGLAFSDQLGFSVYGDWAPFGESVPWLVFNMPTLIAAVLVVAVFRLERNPGFKHDLSSFAGLTIVFLVVAMIVRVIWINPALDAPINSAQIKSDQLPALISLSLFIFAGFSAFLIRLLNEEENRHPHGATQFGRLQIGSLMHTLFMLMLALSLASALGIGAWKTHFIDWSDQLNILDYLNLAITSTLNLIYTNADSGTILHTVLLAALCFTGFSFLLMCADQLTLEEADKETVASLVIEAKIPQAIGIFLLSAYFIHTGISIEAWLFIGVLAWVLFTHLVIGISLRNATAKIQSMLCLALVIGGNLQVLAISLNAVMNANYLLPLLCSAIVLLAWILWLPDLKALLAKIRQREEKDLL